MSEEERQELETLRREKQTREQTARAAAALQEAGVPDGFAALLSGGDDADTDRRTAAFCQTYQSSLAEDIRTRLPDRGPVVTPPAPTRPRRGIQRIH